MLFWLGSIEFETSRGRFILSGAPEIYGNRRRLATKEEAAQVWSFLERRLMAASSYELRPLYELYQVLTSEPFNGPTGEPHVSCVIDAVRSALWSKQLHFETEEPFGALPELEWEPPPVENVRKYLPAQTPSELWGRQDSPPAPAANAPASDNPAESPAATASREQKEYSVKVVDEQGLPLEGISMSFRHGSTTEDIATGSNGIAKLTTSDTDVTVTFSSDIDHHNDLVHTMQSIWTPSRQVERKDWVPADDTTATTAVTLLGGAVVKATADKSTTATTRPKETIEPFMGVQPPGVKPGETPDNLTTLSVQPLVIMVRMLGEHFDTDKCFLLPKALDSIRDLVTLQREYALTDLLIVGHTDTMASDEHNLTLSLERTSAMRAYLTDKADEWLPWYHSDKQQSKRWGSTENLYMIETLLKNAGQAQTVLAYQKWHNANAPRKTDYAGLTEDGEMGPNTRKQLVLDYMHREDTTVPDNTAIQVHGCGEFFTLTEDEEHVATSAPDEDEEQRNRRVEVFLFPREVGILPPVPGERAKKGEPEYPEWRRRSVDIELSAITTTVNVSVWLLDTEGQRMLGTPYRMTIGGEVRVGHSTSDGAAVEYGVSDTPSCYMEWGSSAVSSNDSTSDDSTTDAYLYQKTVDFPQDVATDMATDVRLTNLGYDSGTDTDRLQQFAKDYGHESADAAQQQTALVDAHDTGQPRLLSTA